MKNNMKTGSLSFIFIFLFLGCSNKYEHDIKESKENNVQTKTFNPDTDPNGVEFNELREKLGLIPKVEQEIKLGGEVMMLGSIVNVIFGDELLSNLQKYKVNTAYIKKSFSAQIGLGIVNVFENGTLIATISKKANNKLTINDINQMKEEIISANILILQLEMLY